MPASEALKITLVFTRCAQSAVSIDIRFQTMTLHVTSQRDVSPVSADLCSNLFSVFFPLVSTLVSVLVSVSSFADFSTLFCVLLLFNLRHPCASVCVSAGLLLKLTPQDLDNVEKLHLQHLLPHPQQFPHTQRVLLGVVRVFLANCCSNVRIQAVAVQDQGTLPRRLKDNFN